MWSHIENAPSIDEILHPSVRECLRFLKINKGVAINHDGDLPARSGMGSSSCFTVGLLNALHTFKGEQLTKMSLANEAIYIEQDVLKEKIGNQDQIASACGGLNLIEFFGLTTMPFRFRRINIDEERSKLLQDHLMLMFTGLRHFSNQITKTYQFATGTLKELYQLVFDGVSILECGNLVDFGRLLDVSWSLKRQLSKEISTTYIDFLYQTARKAGAIGGKLLGAGGGGFLLVFCEPDKQGAVEKALNIPRVLFRFENKGTHIIANGGMDGITN